MARPDAAKRKRMSVELEAAAVDASRELFRRKPKHVRPAGSPCPNCGAVLLGPWRHACGQSAEELHRSVVRLVAEAFESFTHFDGRFWRTLPLLFKPGQLTRTYIDGHRAGQIPPLRLFLVALLLVFFAGSLGSGSAGVIDRTDKGRPAGSTRTVTSMKDLTPEERAKVIDQMNDIKVNVAGTPNVSASDWLKSRLKAAVSEPERFKLILETWGERFAFLMLPIATVILTVLFVCQRRFYVFDHTIFALHSLAFQGRLISLMFLLQRLAGRSADVLLFAAPVHLFLHLRGVYQASILGTSVRMFLLFVGSTVGFSILVMGLLWVGLSAMGAG